MKYLDQWQIQRGSLWQVLPETAVVPPLKWRPSDENAPLFGVYRSRNKRKNTQSKLNNALLSVQLQYLCNGR